MTIHIIAGPENSERLKQCSLGLAPRLDYRVIAEQSDVKVHLFSSSPAALTGWKWWRLTKSLVKNLTKAFRLLRTLESNPTIYSTGETWALPIAIAATILRKDINQTVYVHRVYSRAWAHIFTAFSWSRTVSTIICVTGNQAAYLQRRLGATSICIHSVSQGVDAKFFNRRLVSEQSTQPYVLSVGSEMRNYQLLFDAIDRIDVTVKVKASSSWMAYRRQSEKALPENVELIEEFLDYAKLRALYAMASVVVIPLHDTMQAAGITTLQEAVAMSVPVIVTRSIGLPDFTNPQGMIYTVAADKDELATAIEKVLFNCGHSCPDKAMLSIEEHASQVHSILTQSKR